VLRLRRRSPPCMRWRGPRLVRADLAG
jgi:hypothetical protein